MKKLSILFVLVLSLVFVGCDATEQDTTSSATMTPTNGKVVKLQKGEEFKERNVNLDTHPLATIEMKNGDKMEIVLLYEMAPNTVNNFIALAHDKFYDGLIFHRVIKDFMIQGGDPEGVGIGGPNYTIEAEFTNKDGYYLPHESGVISMARRKEPDSAGSQFFLVHKKTESLDGKYTSFGFAKNEKTIEIIDKIANVETGEFDRPVNLDEVTIKSITVELNGYEPKEPKTTKLKK